MLPTWPNTSPRLTVVAGLHLDAARLHVRVEHVGAVADVLDRRNCRRPRRSADPSAGCRAPAREGRCARRQRCRPPRPGRSRRRYGSSSGPSFRRRRCGSPSSICSQSIAKRCDNFHSAVDRQKGPHVTDGIAAPVSGDEPLAGEGSGETSGGRVSTWVGASVMANVPGPTANSPDSRWTRLLGGASPAGSGTWRNTTPNCAGPRSDDSAPRLPPSDRRCESASRSSVASTLPDCGSTTSRLCSAALPPVTLPSRSS